MEALVNVVVFFATSPLRMGAGDRKVPVVSDLLHSLTLPSPPSRKGLFIFRVCVPHEEQVRKQECLGAR